jgi:hypothetical protein
MPWLNPPELKVQDELDRFSIDLSSTSHGEFCALASDFPDLIPKEIDQ